VRRVGVMSRLDPAQGIFIGHVLAFCCRPGYTP
jgi:hypothetical protein